MQRGSPVHLKKTKPKAAIRKTQKKKKRALKSAKKNFQKLKIYQIKNQIV